MRVPRGFGEQGNTENLAMGTREQSKKIVGNKGTSNRLGNRGTNTKNYKALRFLPKRAVIKDFLLFFKRVLRTSPLNILQNEDDFIPIPVIIEKVGEVE